MKRISIILLGCLAPMVCFPQSTTFDITGGYCAPIASSFSSITAKEIEIQAAPYFYSDYRSLRSASYGQGGNVAFGFNWFSKKDFGCGLKLNALISSPFSYTTYVSYLSGNSATYNFKDKPFSFQFIPHLSFKHDFKVVSPVIEMGALIGITHVKEDYQATYSSGDVLQSSINNHGGALIGFYSSLGLSFKVSRVVRIMLSVNCSVGSYSPTDWERTSFVVNGVDQLIKLTPSQTYGVYVKELDPTASQSTGVPHRDLKYSVPFSNVGFNAGFSFNFVKKKDRIKDKEKPKELHSF